MFDTFCMSQTFFRITNIRLKTCCNWTYRQWVHFEDPNMVDRGSSSAALMFSEAMEDCCDRSNNLPRMRENIMRVLMQTLRDADHNAHSHETTGGQCNFYTIKGACGLQC